MDKSANPEQGSSSAGESPAGALESQQPRTESMGDDGAFFVGSLPAEVVRRVNALRNLQYDHHKIEASFFEEVHALECRYLSKYQTLYEKRTQIVKGTYEPTEAEAKCSFDEDPEDPTAKEEKKPDEQSKEDKVVGIPEFWLQVLKNSDVVSEIIKEHDEPVLKHLIDVRLTMQNEAEQKGFTIEFEFTPNDYFTNTTLTKTYKLRTGPDEHEPLAYEGPEIVKSDGSTIDWKKGKNVTVKMVKKRQKHKNRGTIRVVTREVHTDSFFNFFTPPVVPEDPEADMEDNDEMQMLAQDFEIGHMLRDSIIPKAVLYYTGEAGDEDDDDFDEDDEDDEDEDDDDDDDDDQEEDDDDVAHHHGVAGRGGHSHHGKHGHGGKSRGGKHGGGGGGAGAGGQQPECKQQ